MLTETKMERKVSGVLIIHNDSSLLDIALQSVKNLIDELIIIDGAYQWVAPFCEKYGENPSTSSDDLIAIVDKSGIPYHYFSGQWESETHKRIFAIEKAKNDIVMNIDSDELFIIDTEELNKFIDSDKVIAECYFPLYFNSTHIRKSKTRNMGGKAVFINKKLASVNSIVDSLLLVVPEEERKNKLQSHHFYQQKIGVIHHLSQFRLGNSGFRRARFYNLLTMRISKKIRCIPNVEFNNDSEFYNCLVNLGNDDFEALNSLFYFHHISAGYTLINDDQEIVKSDYLNDECKNIIEKAFQSMLASQCTKFLSDSNKIFKVFSGHSLFIDLTHWIHNGAKKLTLYRNNLQNYRLFFNIESENGQRERLAMQCEFNDSRQAFECLFDKQLKVNASDRIIAEVVPVSNQRVVNFSYDTLS